MLRDGGDMWMARGAADTPPAGPRAHLLPGFFEFMLGYKDRSAALAARFADRIVPGANGMFLSTLVLDGQVRGTWRRTARARSVEIEAAPFSRLSASDRLALAIPLERYAHFLGMPATFTTGRRA